jgi:membrane protein DedA with SNARE-associated domain
MFGLTLTGIFDLITHYGYVVIFPIAVVEGPIISIISGFLVSLHLLNIYAVFIILILGDLVGDTLYYYIGYFGAGPFVRRWGHVFGISEDNLLTFESHFKKHETVALLLGKTQPTGSLVLATAGFMKIKFNRFLLINLFGTTLKTTILLGVGYYFGKSYVAIDNYLTKGGLILVAVSIGGLLLYIEHHRRPKKI